MGDRTNFDVNTLCCRDRRKWLGNKNKQENTESLKCVHGTFTSTVGGCRQRKHLSMLRPLLEMERRPSAHVRGGAGNAHCRARKCPCWRRIYRRTLLKRPDFSFSCNRQNSGRGLDDGTGGLITYMYSNNQCNAVEIVVFTYSTSLFRQKWNHKLPKIVTKKKTTDTFQRKTLWCTAVEFVGLTKNAIKKGRQVPFLSCRVP